MRAITVVASAGIFCFALPWMFVGLGEAKLEADRQAAVDAASTARAIVNVKHVLSGMRTQGKATVEVKADYAERCCTVTIEYAANQYIQWTDARFDMESAARTLLRAFVVTPDDRRNFNIALFADERTYGETGKPLFIPLGHVFYDYDMDKLSYGR